MKDFGLAIVERWMVAGRAIVASTLAGALAWFVAQTVFGHSHPIFAAIVAIVCLAPGIPSHTRQTLGLLVGVGIGIAIGEFALTFPGDIPLLRGSVSVFVAMVIASSFGLGPVVPIQAAVSTILVFALGPQTAGYVRMIDSIVGIVIALVFSQILFTPNPVKVVEKAAGKILQELARGFSQCDAALTNADVKIAQAAIGTISAARSSVTALDSSIGWARRDTRWSLRGWLMADAVNSVVARYDGSASRLYASTLVFGDALADALRGGAAPPPCLRAYVHEIATLYGEVAAGRAPERPQSLSSISVERLPQDWRSCMTSLLATENALRAIARSVESSSAEH